MCVCVCVCVRVRVRVRVRVCQRVHVRVRARTLALGQGGADANCFAIVRMQNFLLLLFTPWDGSASSFRLLFPPPLIHCEVSSGVVLPGVFVCACVRVCVCVRERETERAS